MKNPKLERVSKQNHEIEFNRNLNKPKYLFLLKIKSLYSLKNIPNKIILIIQYHL